MNNWLDWRPPRGGIAFLAGCFIFASLVFLFIDGGTPYTRNVCPLFLPIGIGLWLKHTWARWLTFAFFIAVGAMLIVLLFNQGFTVRRAIQGFIIAGSLIALWEWNVYPEDDTDGESNTDTHDNNAVNRSGEVGRF